MRLGSINLFVYGKWQVAVFNMADKNLDRRLRGAEGRPGQVKIKQAQHR